MAKKKTDVLQELQRVHYVGPKLAELLYTEHKIRSVSDLVEFGEAGKIAELPRIGDVKSAAMLKSARRIASANGSAQESPAEKPRQQQAPKETKAPPKEPVRRAAAPSKPAPSTSASSASAGATTVEPSPAPTPEPAKKATAAKTPTLEERFLATLRCPACGNDSFELEGTTLTCHACQRQFKYEGGIADLAAPQTPSRSITQRLMETRFYAQFYEEFMRPRLTGVVSDRSMREEYRLSADFLELDENSRLLDVACGTANFTRYFAQRIGLAEAPATRGNLPLVVGMDLSWPMLENARRNIRQENLDGKVFLLRGDATRIPLRRGSYNRLHCAGALHIVNDIDETLRNFARVLEPDGICVIGTFVLGTGLFRRLVKRAAEFPTQFHWFSRDELHKRLERAGFEILDDSVSGDAITVKARRI